MTANDLISEDPQLQNLYETDPKFKENFDRNEFINYLSLKVPKYVDDTLPSVVIGQACKESAFGEKAFYNNILGIKCHGNNPCKKGETSEVIDGILKDMALSFSVYETIDDCLIDYNRIMHYKTKDGYDRYRPVRESRCFQEAAHNLKHSGYATGTTYHLSLIEDYIKPYKLYDYDYRIPFESQLQPNFQYKEAFSSVMVYGKYYKRAIEPPIELMNNVKRVSAQAQILRDYFGRPIKVNSWYRTKDFNASLRGSSPDSMHLTGLAVDLDPLFRISIIDFYKIAKKITNFNGFGIGNTYLHCDLGEQPAVWSY